ncbi:hypothetical protein IQ238_22030 [Pleurocapsales cyanobacterium LEGE 06147]|nr:hypothetical protein [Pleurocapsales cyanobacterium LEGE 06147]
MLTKQSIFLLVLPALLSLSIEPVKANNVEVQTGNLQVSVQEGGVKIESRQQSPSLRDAAAPALRDRLNNLGILRSRVSERSTSQSLGKCSQNNSSHHSTRRSGGGVIQTSSSTSTTTCN